MSSIDFEKCLPNQSFCGIGEAGNQEYDACVFCNESLEKQVYAKEDHSSCVSAENCEWGTFADPKTHQCQKCQNNTFASEEHDKCVIICEIGFWGNPFPRPQCMSCEKGLYSTLNASQCVKKEECDIGTIGQENPSTSKRYCIKCSNNSWAKSDHSECVRETSLCSNNSIADNQTWQCSPCFPQYSNLQKEKCVSSENCDLGAWANPKEGCQKCPEKYFALVNKSSCVLS